jgi:hypothetical protein
MPATTAPPATFSDEELARLLELIKDADSVELKLTIPERHQRSAVEALGMDPLDAQIRQVVFFDTPELALDKQGLVVRARRIQGKGDDSVVKLRPVIPGELPARIRKLTGFRVEVDALPGGYVCSATLKRPLDRDSVRSVLAGERPARKLFSKEQRAFYGDHVEGGIALDDLLALGPILVLKLQFTPKELGRRLVAELWTYPDGSRVLELSTRCGTGDAFQVAAEARAFLAGRGVEISGEQETKTRKALAYFARTMAAAAG